MVAEINKSFKRISRKLFRRSLNYCADFKLFRCEGMSGESLDTVVTAALGNEARVGGAQSATRKEIMDALQTALRYKGDDGAHPSLNYLESTKSEEDFDAVTAEVQGILDRSDLLLSFCAVRVLARKRTSILSRVLGLCFLDRDCRGLDTVHRLQFRLT